LILLLGLILCSFLGGNNCNREGMTNSSDSKNSKSTKKSSSKNEDEDTSDNSSDNKSNTSYDNYNHYTGTSTTLVNGTTFYGPNGASAEYIVASNGTASIKLIQTSGSAVVIFNSTPQGIQSSNSSSSSSSSSKSTSTTTFYGPSGFKATIKSVGNNQYIIIFTLPNGTTQTFTQGSNSSSQINNTQYYGSTGTIMPPSSSYSAYVSGPNGNSAYYAQGPNGNTVAGYNGNNYSSSLSQGIPASQIPPGQEDLYILKSEIVPPVCPACPSSSACPSNKQKCPPCPACARCPEPSFECKKVPNYDAISEEYLPQPVLNSFSTFGS
jgi:hypothetical protein